MVDNKYFKTSSKSASQVIWQTKNTLEICTKHFVGNSRIAPSRIKCSSILSPLSVSFGTQVVQTAPLRHKLERERERLKPGGGLFPQDATLISPHISFFLPEEGKVERNERPLEGGRGDQPLCNKRKVKMRGRGNKWKERTSFTTFAKRG